VRLNSFEALTAFAAQLDRNVRGGEFHTKVVIVPSSVSDKGVAIKVSPLKTYIQDKPAAARSSRALRIRVSVAGTAESMTGLRQALAAIEALDRYLASDGLRLEAADSSGTIKKIANSRIVQAVSAEDSFIDSPDSAAAQDVQDDRIITITIPQGD